MDATRPVRSRVPAEVKKVKNEGEIGGIVLGGQPDAEDIASGRFKTVINCRPDAEEGNVTEQLVQGTGIQYTSIPYTAETLSKAHVYQMRAALETATGTILVHCQGGTRAAVTVAIAQAERAGKGAEDVVAAIEAAGFDIKGRSYEQFIEKYFR